MIRIVAFLGNIGAEYRWHRHNVGWQFLDSMPQYQTLSWALKFKGQIASVDAGETRVLFLKPLTYMNLSGESLAEAARFYRIRPDEVLVVHDELEMVFGAFGYKFSGGLGGHNGLRSIERLLGTRDFWRLRFGIGRPDHDDIASYVLSPFTREEQEILHSAVFPQAAATFTSMLVHGIEGYDQRYKKVQPYKPPRPSHEQDMS
ncbi:MAG: aminoacyl-tRNA hydrolase [Rectinemataceae bacterium]|nr:aminoacyl-tRNA hydrolase [Spirochaetaceae bacterium]